MPHRFDEKFSGFSFSDGEKIRMIIRRHWSVAWMLFIDAGFWTLIIPGITFFLMNYFQNGFEGRTLGLVLIFLSAYIWSSVVWFLIKWLNTVFDVIIVTNDRVIDITQVDFFHRNIVETRLTNVQDATGDVKGFLNTLFDWGRVQVRTANDIANFSIDMVEHPHQKARHIFYLATKAQERSTNRSFELEKKFKERQKAKRASNNSSKNTDQKGFSPKEYRKQINHVLQNR